MVDKKSPEHTPAKPAAKQPKENAPELKTSMIQEAPHKEPLPKEGAIKESTKESTKDSPKNTSKDATNGTLKTQRKKRYPWQIGLLIIVGGVLSIQSYVVYTLLEKITALEEISLHAKKLEHSLSSLDVKMNTLEKDALSKIKFLHEKVKEQLDQPAIQAPPMSEEQFQQYTLGSKQMDAVKQGLSNTFQEKGDAQDKILLQSQALIYFNYLYHAVQNGEPYTKLLDNLKHTLAADSTSTRALTTALDILSLSAAAGLGNYNNLYTFPEDAVLLDEKWPSWLLWIKDYVSFKTSAPKGLSFQDKQRLIQLLDTRQVAKALELIVHHATENPEIKAAWASWLKAAETRVKAQQSLDTIQHFLLERVLP